MWGEVWRLDAAIDFPFGSNSPSPASPYCEVQQDSELRLLALKAFPSPSFHPPLSVPLFQGFEREFKELHMLLFPEVLHRIAHFDRVLSIPGGALLLCGSSGVGRRCGTEVSGEHIPSPWELPIPFIPFMPSPHFPSDIHFTLLRRSAMLLMAYMHHMEFITPKMTRNYDVKAFRNDLKEVGRVSEERGLSGWGGPSILWLPLTPSSSPVFYRSSSALLLRASPSSCSWRTTSCLTPPTSST